MFSRTSLAVLGFLGVLAIPVAGCSRSSGTASPEGKPAATTASAAAHHRNVGGDPGGVGAGTPLQAKAGHELAAFAAGCFWGVEDTFRQVQGVTATAVGYTGGHTEKPTYETVCSHATGHAETVLVEFDPNKVKFEKLVEVFFATHDPTTLNRQGPDIGDQYRSHVFTFSDAQDKIVEGAIARENEKRGAKKVTTKVTRMGAFWKAEEYHQQYDEKTGTHSCPLPVKLGQGT